MAEKMIRVLLDKDLTSLIGMNSRSSLHNGDLGYKHFCFAYYVG